MRERLDGGLDLHVRYWALMHETQSTYRSRCPESNRLALFRMLYVETEKPGDSR